MRFNFYITAENDEEAQACISFIRDMTNKRENRLPEFTPTRSVSIAESVRENISPGDPAITKMGNATKEEILTYLRRGAQPAEKYSEHLKLMWARGEVKYDGTIYYL